MAKHVVSLRSANWISRSKGEGSYKSAPFAWVFETFSAGGLARLGQADHLWPGVRHRQARRTIAPQPPPTATTPPPPPKACTTRGSHRFPQPKPPYSQTALFPQADTVNRCFKTPACHKLARAGKAPSRPRTGSLQPQRPQPGTRARHRQRAPHARQIRQRKPEPAHAPPVCVRVSPGSARRPRAHQPRMPAARGRPARTASEAPGAPHHAGDRSPGTV